jgi:hypothetical protein
MSLVSKIKENWEQRRINKTIEEGASEEEQKAITLINRYAFGNVIYEEKTTFWGRYLGSHISLRNVPPPSSPRPGARSNPNPTEEDYHQDFIKMRNFLEKYPCYKTREAKELRRVYNL